MVYDNKGSSAMTSAVPDKLPLIPATTQLTRAATSQQRADKQHVTKARRGRRKGGDDVIPDIFADHWLVESPRRVQFERTMLAAPTQLGVQLDRFYQEVVHIPEKYLTSARSRTRTLTDYVVPRLVKLGNQIGIKIQGWRIGGSTIDDTQVIVPREIDIWIMIDKVKVKPGHAQPGYRTFPLKRFRAKPGERPDEFRFGRSDDGTYLSSLRVARSLYSLLERALKLNPQVVLEPYTEQDDRPQVVVTFKDKHRFNFIPTVHVESEDVYVSTRPYAYDADPRSDVIWRVSHVDQERRLLALMDRADRGVRRKAFKLLKALVAVEHTLDGLSSYHIKTVLLHAFDQDVDHTPRWQRHDLEAAFMTLLRELADRLSHRQLPHFFIRGYNLFGNVSSRKLSALESRVRYLVEHQSELIRILKKRAS